MFSLTIGGAINTHMKHKDILELTLSSANMRQWSYIL